MNESNQVKELTEPGITSNRRIGVIKIIGLFIGVFLIYWFLSKSNLGEIWGQLQGIGWKFIIVASILFLSFYVDTIGWRFCFFEKPAVGITELFFIRLSGESLAQINPTNVIAGDTMKAVLLKRRGVSYTNSIVSLTVYRFITILAAATFIVAGVYVFFDHIGFLASKYTILMALSIFCLILLYMAYRLQTGLGLFSLVVKVMKAFMKDSESRQRRIGKLTEIDRELVDFFKTKKINFFLAYIMSLVHRFPDVLEYYVIFNFMGINAAFLSCIAVSVGVTVFKALGSFIPGQLGIEEYGNKVMLDFIHVSGSGIWLSVSILRRARQVLWLLLGVVAFVVMVKIKDRDNNG